MRGAGRCGAGGVGGCERGESEGVGGGWGGGRRWGDVVFREGVAGAEERGGEAEGLVGAGVDEEGEGEEGDEGRKMHGFLRDVRSVLWNCSVKEKRSAPPADVKIESAWWKQNGEQCDLESTTRRRTAWLLRADRCGLKLEGGSMIAMLQL